MSLMPKVFRPIPGRRLDLPGPGDFDPPEYDDKEVDRYDYDEDEEEEDIDETGVWDDEP